MTFTNTVITVTVGTDTFAAEKAEVSYEMKVSETAMLSGGVDRALLGSQLKLTLEGKYLKAQSSAFFHTLAASLAGGNTVSPTVENRTYTSLYADKLTLTEHDDDPYGSFVFVLREL